jgi:Icc-related predicted phosphoesterase
MRLQIFSDVHFDVMDVYEPVLAPGVDAVVAAGDLCEGMDRGMAWLRHHLGDDVAIVLVPGNHEFYARVRSEERQAAAEAARRHRVTLLDDETAVIGGVRFVGSTLWADFELFGADLKWEAMTLAQGLVVDHRRIWEAPGRFFSPEDALRQHCLSRAWMGRRLAEPHAGPTVVVTHHGPHPSSLAAKFRDDMLSAAFISDLSELIERRQPALWVHGHTHVSFDYCVGATRIICNPHGYGGENPAFDPALVVEV